MITEPVPVSPHDAEAPQITPIRAVSKSQVHPGPEPGSPRGISQPHQPARSPGLKRYGQWSRSTFPARGTLN